MVRYIFNEKKKKMNYAIESNWSVGNIKGYVRMLYFSEMETYNRIKGYY
ncbi:hypothetical protein [Candidatus Hodgkinia cicadicola]